MNTDSAAEDFLAVEIHLVAFCLYGTETYSVRNDFSSAGYLHIIELRRRRLPKLRFRLELEICITVCIYYDFLPDLKLHLAYGYDYAVGKGYTFIPETAASNYDQKGYYSPYGPAEKHNNIFTAYLNYNTDIKKFRIDVTAGYDWQYWKATA